MRRTAERLAAGPVGRAGRRRRVVVGPGAPLSPERPPDGRLVDRLGSEIRTSQAGSLGSPFRGGRWHLLIWPLLLVLSAATLVVLAPSAGAAHDDEPVDEGRHPNSVDDRPRDDIKYYADALLVAYGEAERRFAVEDAVRAFRWELSEELGDGYADVWIQHEPDYRIFAGALVADVPRAASLLEDESFADEAEVVEVGYSLVDLRAAAARVREVSPVPIDTGIDSSVNAVMVYVAGDENRRLLDDALAAAGLAARSELVRSELVVETVEELAKPFHGVHGGLRMGVLACTTGFSVRRVSDGALGIVTAAHCGLEGPIADNTVMIDESYAPFQEGRQHGSWDVQWHTVPGRHIRNEIEYVHSPEPPEFADTRRHLGITSVRTTEERRSAKELGGKGDVVCKSGLVTKYTCGTTIWYDSCPTRYVTNCKETFVTVERVGSGDMANEGDSGGPVFRKTGNGSAEAVGIVSGGYWFYGRNRMTYMPIEFIADLGLEVLTFEPPNPEPWVTAAGKSAERALESRAAAANSAARAGRAVGAARATGVASAVRAAESALGRARAAVGSATTAARAADAAARTASWAVVPGAARRSAVRAANEATRAAQGAIRAETAARDAEAAAAGAARAASEDIAVFYDYGSGAARIHAWLSTAGPSCT